MDISPSSNFKGLICFEHNKQIEFIYLKDDSNSKLACNKCYFQNKLDHDYMIEIESLLKQKEETVYKNLPPGLKSELYDQLNDKSIQKSNKDALIEQVTKEFKHFTDVFVQLFDSEKKKIINIISAIDEERISVINNYNLISQKEEIQKKTIELSNNPKELNQFVKNLISEKKDSKEKDQKIIQDCINNVKNMRLKINVDYIQNCLLEILEKVKSTNFLYSSENKNFNSYSINSNSDNKIEKIIEKKNDNERKIINNNSNNKTNNINNNNDIQPQQQIKSVQQNNQNNNNNNNNHNTVNSSQQLSSISSQSQQQQQQDQQFISKLTNIFKQIIGVPSSSSSLIQEQIRIKSIQELQSIKNLQQHSDINIDLYNKGIGDVEMEQISKCLHLCQITTHLILNLSDNNIANKGILQLFQGLYQMKSLSELTLWLNNNPKITEEGYAELTKLPLSCYSQSIRYLNLSLSDNKNVSDKVASSILTIISTYSQLSQLRLYFKQTKITGNTVKQIANSIKSLNHLTELYLHINNNEIEDEDAFILLSNTITSYLNSSLIKVTLQLNNNNIGNNAALSLVDAFTNCSKLQSLKLYLQNNRIGQQYKQKIQQIEQKLSQNYCKQLSNPTIQLD